MLLLMLYIKTHLIGNCFLTFQFLSIKNIKWKMNKSKKKLWHIKYDYKYGRNAKSCDELANGSSKVLAHKASCYYAHVPSAKA